MKRKSNIVLRNYFPTKKKKSFIKAFYSQSFIKVASLWIYFAFIADDQSTNSYNLILGSTDSRTDFMQQKLKDLFASIKEESQTERKSVVETVS